MHSSTDMSYDKGGDQHDSGIDVSDPPNSTASSTRSSPSTESKVKAELVGTSVNLDKLLCKKPTTQLKCMDSDT